MPPYSMPLRRRIPVIVSVPVGASGTVAEEIAPALKKGAILTDVGSAKASVIAQMQRFVPEGVHFIPGHPLAGTEKSGPDAGFAELFENRWCIFTPLEGTDPVALENSGAAAAPTSKRWTRSTTTRLWRSSRTCRTLSPTASSAQRTTWRRSQGARSSNIRPPASAILLASPLPTPQCGATCACTTAMRSSKCWRVFRRISPPLQRAIRWGDGDKLFDLFTRTRAIPARLSRRGRISTCPISAARQVGLPQGRATAVQGYRRLPRGRQPRIGAISVLIQGG